MRLLKIPLLGLVLLGCLFGCTLVPQKEVPKVPVFLFVQAAPDGKTIEALVPSELVTLKGDVSKVVAALSPKGSYDIVRFGKILGKFETAALSSADVFGPIAIFKLENTISPSLLQQPNLLLVPKEPVSQTQSSSTPQNRPYQYTCPSKVQRLVLDKSRPLFEVKLKVSGDRLKQVAISSITCLDINRDGQPEIFAGLRLDNPNRPSGIESKAWLDFLGRPKAERQEYSMMVALRKVGDDWQASNILTHSRALAYVGDSIGSFALFGAHDLDGDGLAESIVQEIGLSTLDARVVRLDIVKLNGVETWQWRSYYQENSPLDIVQ